MDSSNGAASRLLTNSSSGFNAFVRLYSVASLLRINLKHSIHSPIADIKTEREIQTFLLETISLVPKPLAIQKVVTLYRLSKCIPGRRGYRRVAVIASGCNINTTAKQHLRVWHTDWDFGFDSLIYLLSARRQTDLTASKKCSCQAVAAPRSDIKGDPPPMLTLCVHGTRDLAKHNAQFLLLTIV
jgi:hypothetical protein